MNILGNFIINLLYKKRERERNDYYIFFYILNIMVDKKINKKTKDSNKNLKSKSKSKSKSNSKINKKNQNGGNVVGASINLVMESIVLVYADF